MVTVGEFRTQFPEFAGVADETIMAVLPEATAIHGRLKIATLFCAAHLITLNQNIAQGITTSPEKTGAGAGSLSVSYMTQAESGREAFFTSTSYGQRFLNLEKRYPRTGIGAMVVG